MEKKHLIQLLKECGAIQFGHFILTSGAASKYYIDIKKASTNPKILKILAQQMSKYTQDIDIIAGMELGAVPLVTALSLETNIPYVILRKQKRTHGTAKQIEGGDVQHKNILLVEDVTTSGGSLLKSIQILHEHNAKISKAIVIVDRESGASEKIAKLDIEFIPLLTVTDILKK